MGMSANRNPGQMEGQTPIRAPVVSQVPVNPIAPAAPVAPAPMQGLQPFQYPRLQHAVGSGNPMGAFLGKLLMHGLENRRMQMGQSPQDWQTHLNAMLAMKRGLPIP